MTADELKARFPNASGSFFRANGFLWQPEFFDHHSGKAAVMEPDVGNGTMVPVQVQAGVGKRFFVRITSVRKRLLDQDNLCEKFHVDLLRHAGIISSDAPSQSEIEVRQRKAAQGEPECVILEVFKR